jgi:hypothetical protein
MLAVGEHVLGSLDPMMVRLTTGLCGGIGCTYAEVCGALSGGVLVIGALHRYRERFAAEFGTTLCGPLRDQVRSPGGLGSCSLVAERAALILLDVLDEA